MINECLPDPDEAALFLQEKCTIRRGSKQQKVRQKPQSL